MVSMFTPETVKGTSDEMFFRRRALELSEQLDNEILWEDAIVNVVVQLVREGLCMRISDVNKDIAKMISDQIGDYGRSTDRTTLLIIYHYLIWKTAGGQTWTLPRNIGDQRAIPYHPRLLKVTKMSVTAETCVNGESWSFVQPSLRQDVAELLKDSDCWREVSILEFTNACMPEESRLVGPKSQPVVQVITKKDRSLTWREAEDHDNLRGEEIFQNVVDGEPEKYVRTDGDIRKLYESRPDRLKPMVLGHFASDFRKIKSGGCGLESAEEKIDPETGLGPASTTPVAGNENEAAPLCMKLKNGKIMQKRSGPRAVLHLLQSGAPGRHGNQLLWSPWQYLEEVSGDQQEEESDAQKRTRLSIFPMSVYPSLTEKL